MARFIEGRHTTNTVVDDDLLELTPATLRSMIPGDFFLIPNPISQGRVLPELTNCILMLHEKGLLFSINRSNSGRSTAMPSASFGSPSTSSGIRSYFQAPTLATRKTFVFTAASLNCRKTCSIPSSYSTPNAMSEKLQRGRD